MNHLGKYKGAGISSCWACWSVSLISVAANTKDALYSLACCFNITPGSSRFWVEVINAMLTKSCRLAIGLLLLAASTQAASTKQPARQSVFDCLKSNHVTYLTPSSADWAAYQAPFNLRLSYAPEVIAVPSNDAQVGAAVRCAAAANLKVQAKGGGHSYASYSSGGRDGSFIIELEKFDEITVDPCKL